MAEYRRNGSQSKPKTIRFLMSIRGNVTLFRLNGADANCAGKIKWLEPVAGNLQPYNPGKIRQSCEVSHIAPGATLNVQGVLPKALFSEER
jgi:hypothetical protein